MLLGTVGVLVVCRLALAALLIIGPVFIVLALFEGTRGLFEGWLKSVAMFALVPLLTVVMGSGALAAISPMVTALDQANGVIPLRTAVTILTASIIYLTLMILVFKVAGNLTKGWRIGRFAAATPASHAAAPVAAHQERAFTPSTVTATNANITSDRVRSTVASIEAAAMSSRLPAPAMARIAALPASAPVPALPGPSDARGQMRYLHHRVAGATNNVSREIFR
jgi:type IV secretion system protein VirB6